LLQGAPLSASPTAVHAYAARDDATGHWSVRAASAAGDSSEWLPVAAAHGYYDEGNLNSTGWALLDIAAPAHSAGETGMYGLGFLEAHFTCPRMHQFGLNFMASMFGKEGPDVKLLEWVQESLAWVRQQAADAASAPGEDGSHVAYWQAVRGMLAQFDGLVDGYVQFCPHLPPLDASDLLLINLNGDLFDILPALKLHASRLEDLNSMRFGEAAPLSQRQPQQQDEGRTLERPAHCSAAIKLLPGEKEGTFEDLFVGHATWDTFSNAWPRIFKHHSLPVMSPSGEWSHHTASFSSSPGFLSSIDDFYSISGRGQLFVQETSISTLNSERYAALKPQSVPCFIRAVVANRLAADGQEWADTFSREHSGTYADQWMVVDRSRFTPGADLSSAKGLLWVLEEGPGLIMARDMTPLLVQQGYWSSFNVAFFPEMRDYMGYTNATKTKGPEYSYQGATRARLFKELTPQVDSLLGMQWMMRWNDYSVDPISNGNPVRAIAARGDLKPPVNGKRSAFGATDSKVSSWRLAEEGEVAAHVIAGPTREQLPMFCWTDADFDESHVGHPDCFNMTHLAVPKSENIRPAGTHALFVFDVDSSDDVGARAAAYR